MGRGQKILPGSGRINFLRLGSGWVSHLWFGFEFGKFPLKKFKFSIFCPSGQKKSFRVGSESTQVRGGSASYLLRVKSKLGSGPISKLGACWPPCIQKIYFFILDEFFQDWECYGDFDVLWFFWLQNIVLHLWWFSLEFTFFIPGEFCMACFDDQGKIVPNVGW